MNTIIEDADGTLNLGKLDGSTWKEAMVRWLDERPNHRGRDNLLGYLRRIDPLFGELPPHLAAMTRFSLATGLREVNVVGLEWAQVDLAQRRAWIHADQVKSG